MTMLWWWLALMIVEYITILPSSFFYVDYHYSYILKSMSGSFWWAVFVTNDIYYKPKVVFIDHTNRNHHMDLSSLSSNAIHHPHPNSTPCIVRPYVCSIRILLQPSLFLPPCLSYCTTYAPVLPFVSPAYIIPSTSASSNYRTFYYYNSIPIP